MSSEATWGDFAEFAARQLSDSYAALVESSTRATLGEHSSRSAALAEVCRLLHGFVGEFGPISVSAVTPAEISDLQLNLQYLGSVLDREAASAPHEPNPLAGWIRDAGEMLKLSQDLLATHHFPGRSPRSPYAAYLDSPAGASHLLGATVRLAGLAGATAVQLGHTCPPTPRNTRRWVSLSQRLTLSAIQVERVATNVLHRIDGLDDPLVVPRAAGALPAAALLRPAAVMPGESQDTALRSVVSGSEWLAAHAVRLAAERLPNVTPAELITASNRTALSHLIAARLLEHTRDLLTPDTASTKSLNEACQRLRTAAHVWQAASQSWGSSFHSTPAGQPTAMAREAEFVTVRLGRTLFSYGWTPRDTTRHPRPAADIITGPEAHRPLLNAVRAVPAAGEVLAEHLPMMALIMAQRGVLLSSDPTFNPRGSDLPAQMQKGWTRWYQATPDQLAPVAAAYLAARSASAAAETAAARVARDLGHPILRSYLDADRRQTLGFSGDPESDAQRVRASAARARSVLTPSPKPDGPREFKERTRALRREIAEVYGTDRAKSRHR
ncbi:hypothetical protein [Kitasatospora terrestris]|uniref:Uncharacterized protein n=1 Tax=Kitasatospora terrestris TaxID=258051 RepID=A0ABP9DBR8_9ACTN